MEEIIKNIIGLNNTYIGEAPIDVDECQWIRVMSGRSEVHFEKDTYDHLYYSICCRGKSNQEAKNRIKQMYDALKNYTGQNYVILIERTPYYVGRDDKYRAIYKFEIEYQLGGF